jgi:hypothetical protein
MYDGVIQPSVDNRMEWIFRHQAAVPESQGDILPEPIASLSDYRRRILQPMYQALEAHPGGDVLKRDFFNARGAVLKSGRRALEIRVIDMQECVQLDIAIAVFVRSLLRHYSRQYMTGRTALPPRKILLEDFRATVRCGSAARVVAPQLGDEVERDADGRASARDTLRALSRIAQRTVRRDEARYLDLVSRMIEAGTLSERIRDRLTPLAGDAEQFRSATRNLYRELSDCLIDNTPWGGRW